VFQDCVVDIMSKRRVQRSGFRNPVGARDILFCKTSILSPWPNQTHIQYIHGYFPTNHSFPFSARVKNEWSWNFTPAMWFHGFYRVNCTLTLPLLLRLFFNGYSYIFLISPAFVLSLCVCTTHLTRTSFIFVRRTFCNLTSIHFSVCHVFRNFMEFI